MKATAAWSKLATAVAALVATALLVAVAEYDEALINELTAARALFDKQRTEALIDAFDPGEVNEALHMPRELFVNPDTPQDQVFRFADEAFELERRVSIGFGNGLTGQLPGGPKDRPNLRRIHEGTFGAPEGSSCAGCHTAGGLNGAGTRTQNIFLEGDGQTLWSALERNPPHVIGLGAELLVAREMTAQLRARVMQGLGQATVLGEDAVVYLLAKGVDFGTLTVHPDGTIDDTNVIGIDSDLQVKPFGWKGNFSDLRAIADESLAIHFGLQSEELIDRALATGDWLKVGAPGGSHFDPDGDGVQQEVAETELDAFEFYFSMLEIPEVVPPTDPTLFGYWAQGVTSFRTMGCLDCHRVLTLAVPRACVGQRADGSQRCVDLLTDPDEPRLGSQTNAFGDVLGVNALGEGFVVPLFSDLKRHDMGPELEEPRPHRGVAGNVWMTRPLWALADTAPYLHDGRATTVDEAIRFHGGEASAARSAYEAANERDRAALRVFLMSLTRDPKLVIQ